EPPHPHAFPTRRSSDLADRLRVERDLRMIRADPAARATLDVLVARPEEIDGAALDRSMLVKRALDLLKLDPNAAEFHLTILAARSEEHTSALQSREHLV